MRLAVIGAGYVGLVTGTCLADHGHTVTCVDKESSRIELLERGAIPIYEPGLQELVSKNVADGRLCFTTDTGAAVVSSEIVFIAVGTPPGPEGQADLSFVREAAISIGKAMDGYRVVVNKSTVPVGTTDLVAGILAEQSPFPFDVVSNPEFLGEGTAVENCMHPDRIIVGANSDRAAEHMKELYSTFDAPIVVTDPRSAEMIKYTSNAFLAVKISFINEIAGLCDLLGADVKGVSYGVGLDPRIGPAFLRAGIGYGGFCLPKDVRALLHLGNRVKHDMPLIAAAHEVNQAQRQAMVDRILAALGSFAGKSVAVLGLAFKPNTDDAREAPALEIISAVLAGAGSVRAYDPEAMAMAEGLLRARRDDASDPSRLLFCGSTAETCEGADAVVLLTEWAEFATVPWDSVLPRMRGDLFFDGRNFLDAAKMRTLGFTYFGIGRGALPT